MRDAEIDPETDNEYECFECGTIITAPSSPGSCPECDGELRNRGTPLE